MYATTGGRNGKTVKQRRPAEIINKKKKNNQEKDMQYGNMLSHEILTAKEEKALGRKIRKAVHIKTMLTEIVESKQQEQEKQWVRRTARVMRV